MAGISLTLEYVDPAEYFPGVHPIRITATSTEEGLDSSIFVFHAREVDGALPGDTFECVASYQQTQELPIDAPIIEAETPIPYYRKNVVEFYLLSAAEVDDIWNIVQSDTKHLVRSARFWEKIGVTETVEIEP